MAERRPREGFAVDENGNEIRVFPPNFTQAVEQMWKVSQAARAVIPKIRDVEVEVVDVKAKVADNRLIENKEIS
jgi:hypothetical protein